MFVAMKLETISLKLTLLGLCSSFSVTLNAHSGGLDSTGGHFDRSTGLYHCHSQSCSPEEISQATEGYNRDEWIHWIDEDNDCQDLRAELLIESSIEPVTFKSSKACIVDLGLWVTPYSRETLTRASNLDVDHVVPLKYAHEAGASVWSRMLKRQFANDLRNVLLVSRTENRKKGAKGPADYLPTKEFQCDYAKIWAEVSEIYGLTLRFKDANLITKILSECH